MLYFLSNFSSKETLNALYKKELKEKKKKNKEKKKRKKRKKEKKKKECAKNPAFFHTVMPFYTLYTFEFLNL